MSVIDAAHFLREWRTYQQSGARQIPAPGQRPVFELMLEQAECADVLVLNKCDLATDPERAELEEILHGLNSRAEIVRADHALVDSALLLGRPRFDAQETLRSATWLRTLNRLAPTPAPGGAAAIPPGGFALNPRNSPLSRATGAAAHERKFGITSVVYQARRPFAEDKLRKFLLQEAPGLLRAKGFFWTHERPDEMGFLSVAGGVARLDYLNYWWGAMVESGKVTREALPEAIRTLWQDPGGDRRQELVFIGVGLAADKLMSALDNCAF